jgi:preprotein translocase subunit SecA
MDYLQEGIGLRAMAQRDPLVEYQREGFDMFAAMMDAIKEESVGFLFNLEVEIEAGGGAATTTIPAASASGVESDVDADDDGERTDEDAGGLRLDKGLLAAAQDAHESTSHGPGPQISARGLGRQDEDRSLTYSSPELGSDAPSVQTSTTGKDGATTPAKRQAPRGNPNRGSRGNKSKRKR